MNIYNQFRKTKEANQTKFTSELQKDIEQNSKSILYKYYQDGQWRRIENTPQKEQEKLPTKGILKRKPENVHKKLQIYRSVNNILFDFETFIMYNKILGEGSYSKVYLGEFKKTRKLVAIKTVEKLEENQIACLMNSQSPYIIKLHSFWNLNGQSYIALQLCDGNLREIIEKISIDQKIQFFEQIIQGMDYLNKKNIIHRDLKFQNILVRDGTIKISDFGFAKPIGSKLTVLSQKCGTPYTMAPQIYFYNGQGKPLYSHKCDIYSLGVILHEMLYNKHPYDYCPKRMRNNQKVNVQKKFGYLDILIKRSLELQVNKRCNWNQFMQIFCLYKMKKNQNENKIVQLKNLNKIQIAQKENRKCFQNPLKKVRSNNLLKNKRNNYITLDKKPFLQQYEQNKQFQKRQSKSINPFKEINLANTNKNLKQKSEEFKPMSLYPQTQRNKKENHRFKHESQSWKFGHDQIFNQGPEKPNEVENEVVSAVKLVTLILLALILMTLAQKDYQ